MVSASIVLAPQGIHIVGVNATLDRVLLNLESPPDPQGNHNNCL
jgi:hypothetical protein